MAAGGQGWQGCWPTFSARPQPLTLLPAFIMLIVCVACGVVWVGTGPDIYLVWLGEVS